MATAIVAPVADEIDRRRAFRVIPGGVANGQLGDDVEVVFGPRQRILARRTSCRPDAEAALSSPARRSPAETALAQACGVLIFLGTCFGLGVGAGSLLGDHGSPEPVLAVEASEAGINSSLGD